MKTDLNTSGKKNNKEKYHGFLRWLAPKCSRVLFGYRAKPQSLDLGEPFILMCNHQTNIDLAFMYADIKEYFLPVSSEHVLRMPVAGKLVKKLIDPIVVVKGSIKVKGTATILRTIRRGTNIMIHPEGTRTMDGVTCKIGNETGKLVKASKAALVTYRIRCGYFVMPRWSPGIRRGKAEGNIQGIYSSEELKEKTAEEITELIRRDLYVDDYELQDKVHERYRCRKPAEGIERLLFICPTCHKVGDIHGKGRKVFCDCGYTEELDEYGYLGGVSLKDIVQNQRDLFDEMYDDDIMFEDDNAELLTDGKVIEKGILRGYADRLIIGERTFMFETLPDEFDLIGAADRAVFVSEGVHYEIRGNKLNLFKYQMLFDKFKDHFTKASE